MLLSSICLRAIILTSTHSAKYESVCSYYLSCIILDPKTSVFFQRGSPRFTRCESSVHYPAKPFFLLPSVTGIVSCDPTPVPNYVALKSTAVRG